MASVRERLEAQYLPLVAEKGPAAAAELLAGWQAEEAAAMRGAIERLSGKFHGNDVGFARDILEELGRPPTLAVSRELERAALERRVEIARARVDEVRKKSRAR